MASVWIDRSADWSEVEKIEAIAVNSPTTLRDSGKAARQALGQWRRLIRGVGRGGRRRQAMPMDANDIERLIKLRIPDAHVTIRDLAGDGDHYAATVVAESFRGKSRVQQHQLVYEALKAEMGGKLHALALQTGTPER
jgi:stress-induced morphogen